MVERVERHARALVRAVYFATDGKPSWWSLPNELNDVTKEAIAFAVDRGWMVLEGRSICLTDEGRKLVTTQMPDA